MNNWQYHDKKMKELKQLYLKINKQTQNKLQEIFDTFNYTSDNIYNIADSKTKKRINTYIEEWKEKGLLTGYFGTLANNIYRRTRVKNSEILELLIYGAYVEEQSKLKEQELNIMYDDVNYYYQQGQQEVNNTLSKKQRKPFSVLKWALFLALLDQPNVTGFNLEQYVDVIIKYNAEQIYKQAIINIHQAQENDIDNSIFQNIINKQQNVRLCINGDKISGAVDNELIGLNNLAKIEGIKEFDSDAKVRFIAVEDEKTTPMCHSLDGQTFYIDKENEFNRYYGETQKDLRVERIKCKGLVLGLNLPPISHHFHFCRSTITYQVAVENEAKTEYNTVDYIRKENLSNNENLNNNIAKAIEQLPEHIQKLIKDTKYTISNTNSYYDRKNDTIHLLDDSNEYEILHEIGHAVETKLDILHDDKYIEIQKDGLEDINPITDIDKIEGYGTNDFIKDTGKFISEYQRRVYEEDIDKNSIVNYTNFTFNSKTLGEYFAEGFRCYFEDNELLKEKDLKLYNYIKGVLK